MAIKRNKKVGKQKSVPLNFWEGRKFRVKNFELESAINYKYVKTLAFWMLMKNALGNGKYYGDVKYLSRKTNTSIYLCKKHLEKLKELGLLVQGVGVLKIASSDLLDGGKKKPFKKIIINNKDTVCTVAMKLRIAQAERLAGRQIFLGNARMDAKSEAAGLITLDKKRRNKVKRALRKSSISGTCSDYAILSAGFLEQRVGLSRCDFMFFKKATSRIGWKWHSNLRGEHIGDLIKHDALHTTELSKYGHAWSFKGRTYFQMPSICYLPHTNNTNHRNPVNNP